MESVIIQRLQHVDDKIDIDEFNLTPIQEFYKGTKIFITGCTGLLGHLLLEKLLRSCPISTIYVLIRAKKGKDMDSRLNTMLDGKVFERLQKMSPDFRKKVVAVEGDCSLPQLGLNDQDKNLLINEVNIIFHVAATVNFDAKLKIATAINVKSTRDLAQLAQQMLNFKSFVHVSTAYANCISKVIEEKVYPTPMNYKDLINVTGYLDNQLLEVLRPMFVGKYPNTYVYTKQIAEDVVREETKGLAAGIYRPAIVVSTYKEPICGWINNMYGVTGLFYGVGMGLLRVIHADKDCLCNMIPADMCVNGLIASAWDVVEKFKREQEFEVPVYNYESTNDKPITNAGLETLSSKYGVLTPTIHNLWINYLVLIKNDLLYSILTFLLHLVPAAIVDTVLVCMGRKRQFLDVYKKIHSFSSALSFFGVRNFEFKSENIHRMLAHMSRKDRDVFFCDLRELDWDDYFITYGPGARLYLANDPLDTLPRAKKLWNRLWWADKALRTVLATLAITFVWFVVSAIYRHIYV